MVVDLDFNSEANEITRMSNQTGTDELFTIFSTKPI